MQAMIKVVLLCQERFVTCIHQLITPDMMMDGGSGMLCHLYSGASANASIRRCDGLDVALYRMIVRVEGYRNWLSCEGLQMV